jgi:hypothetical protein
VLGGYVLAGPSRHSGPSRLPRLAREPGSEPDALDAAVDHMERLGNAFSRPGELPSEPPSHTLGRSSDCRDHCVCRQTQGGHSGRTGTSIDPRSFPHSESYPLGVSRSGVQIGEPSLRCATMMLPSWNQETPLDCQNPAFSGRRSHKAAFRLNRNQLWPYPQVYR